jgi:cytochrome P450 family 6
LHTIKMSESGEIIFSRERAVDQFTMLFQIAVVLLCIYLWFRNRYEFFKRLGIPFAPASVPFGSSSKVGRTEHFGDFLKKEYEKFKNQGPAFGTFLFAKPMLIPTDPELIKDIFVRNFESFHDHGLSINEDADPLSQNLFFKDGQEWKDLRAKLSPTFTSGKMKMMFPNVVRNCDRMINYLKPFAEKNEPHEMKEVYSSFTTEVITDVAFGLETQCLGNPDNEFRKMAKKVFEPDAWDSMKVFFVFAFEGLAKILRMGFNPKEVIVFFLATVRDTLEHREKNNVQRNDFFQLLMNIKKTEGMSFNEMAANSFVFFVAG